MGNSSIQKSENNVSNFFHKYSENIGGVVSLAGNFYLAAKGKSSASLPAALFFIAEGSLAYKGNTVGGYSLGAASFSIGDLLLAQSSFKEGNRALGKSMKIMGIAWGLGALRYPLEKLSQSTDNKTLKSFCKKTADTIPLITSAINIFCQFPAALFAFKSGDKTLGIAISCWAASHIFTGRLTETVGKLKALFVKNDNQTK